MNKPFIVITLSTVFFSCKKNSSDTGNNPPGGGNTIDSMELCMQQVMKLITG